jgi:transcriptional regulator with XRE-family HTH domain
MNMALAEKTDLRKSANFRRNLQRVCESWARIPDVAEQAGIHDQQVRKIIRGETHNPGIETLEKISIALEIALETLLSDSPSEAELRIPNSRKTA